ncbi:MAG: peptidoglycan editing factor PgeF [Oscillospiraceae bacterium]|jgi:YfiH family protein
MSFTYHRSYITCNAIKLLHGFGMRDGALPLPAGIIVATSRQVHGDCIRVIDGRDYFPEADGLMTDRPEFALCIRTADCTPIFLHDPVKRAIAAVHAGWRGTALDIAGKAVREMSRVYGSKPYDIVAAVGPAIGKCCFETDYDVPEAVRELLKDDAGAFIEKAGDKYHVDIPSINAFLLRRSGVGHVELLSECTRCNDSRFWSYRAQGSAAGRQLNYIVLQGSYETIN